KRIIEFARGETGFNEDFQPTNLNVLDPLADVFHGSLQLIQEDFSDRESNVFSAMLFSKDTIDRIVTAPPSIDIGRGI
ncbi:hypothetical protein K0M31_012268, partial [Melipona bicolor]